MAGSNLKICDKGHRYDKSSNCNVCPVCDREQKITEGFLAVLSTPAQRALRNHGILSLEMLSQYTEKEILSFHGVGISSIPKLKEALNSAGLSFKT
ncbi:helix-hairpin-helix domain-containing protein [Pedobacter montanisoli]|uniref:RNA polymerase alpha subunit C-terminal domain-containing protein n=1 Tax=Pedobacter montanisoli TaxID=2923277 RepID=A0ABS9ZZ48_9SPHI|nr:hypothetical protein [Pedobacter montanisoli]MCJ0743555.1 hypothetical protein [Pedobacter montanisoli]